MATRLTLEELIKAATELAPEERDRLIRALRPRTAPHQRHITELRGLGKEIWNGIDAQEYVDAERDAWED